MEAATELAIETGVEAGIAAGAEVAVEAGVATAASSWLGPFALLVGAGVAIGLAAIIKQKKIDAEVANLKADQAASHDAWSASDAVRQNIMGRTTKRADFDTYYASDEAYTNIGGHYIKSKQIYGTVKKYTDGINKHFKQLNGHANLYKKWVLSGNPICMMLEMTQTQVNTVQCLICLRVKSLALLLVYPSRNASIITHKPTIHQVQSI